MQEKMRDLIKAAKADSRKDQYHSMDELYLHRNLLFAFIAMTGEFKCEKSPVKDGWFILRVYIPPKGQIAYHLSEHFFPLLQGVPTLSEDEFEEKWDGHGSWDTVDRLIEWIELEIRNRTIRPWVPKMENGKYKKTWW
jgi:hypothetical protein